VSRFQQAKYGILPRVDPMKTGWTAWTFALAGFLLPYMFVYNNSLLLMGLPLHISFSIVTSLIGVICLGGGIIGYFFRATRIHERLLLFAAALLLIKPGLITDIGGFLCVVITVFLQLKGRSSLVTDQAAS